MPTKKRMPFRNDNLLLLACFLLYGAATARYGLTILLSLGISCLVGYAVERAAFVIKKKTDVSYGYLYWVLLPLVLPPSFPLWMVATTALFSTLVCIVFFGGFGRHIVSPVATGWTFALLSYPTAFGFSWSFPFPGLFEGFKHFSAALPTINHPVTLYAARAPVALPDILFGNFPQPPGGAIPLLLLIIGVSLIILKVIDGKSVLFFTGTITILTVVFHSLFPEQVGSITSWLVGDFLFATFFIFPEVRTASRTRPGRWLGGIITGILAFVIRNFSATPDGVFFAILLGNVFSPMFDEMILSLSSKRHAA